MKKIISVSRRTDIPAFFGKRFLDDVKKGEAFYKNPYNKKESRISLKSEDVASFVFWSKNFIPFKEVLSEIKRKGYNFYFNYTINNYPEFLEPHLPKIEHLIENLKYLSDTYSPQSINWRYDPIIISDKTTNDFHIKNFQVLASYFKGYTERCIISFVSLYKKTRTNFKKTEKEKRIKFYEPELAEKIKTVNILSGIAAENNITLYSCCSDEIIDEKIKKASCIDANLIIKLFYKDKLIDFKSKLKPTRAGCGCFDAIDIGEYKSCSHNCIYCYAG